VIRVFRTTEREQADAVVFGVAPGASGDDDVIDVGARDLALTLSGRNIALWSKYVGTDPEVNAIGRTLGGGRDSNYLDAVDAFNLPIPRRVGISVSLGY